MTKNLSLQHPVSFYKVTFDLKGWPLWYSMVALTTTFIDWEYELWLQTGSSGTLVMQLVKITNFINLKCELWPQTGTLLEPRCICSYKLIRSSKFFFLPDWGWVLLYYWCWLVVVCKQSYMYMYICSISLM